MDLEVNHERFQISSDLSNNQFNLIYQHRLEQISPSIIPSLPAPIVKHINSIVDNNPCSIVGLVYKDLVTRRNILDDYRNLGGDSSHDPPLEKSADDKIYLEDITGRVELVGIDPASFQTGTVLGFHGILSHVEFRVDQIFTPALLPHKLPESSSGVIAFISCLEINNSNLKPFHFALSAALKNSDTVVLLGNNFEVTSHEEEGETLSFQAKMKLKETLPVSVLSSFIATIGKPTIVMPGTNDPVSLKLPQQPYHKILLRGNNTILCTNPSNFNFHGYSFITISGEQTQDMERTTNLTQHQSAESLLKWHHLAPNAPDHLPCISVSDKDLLVIDEAPDVLVYGLARSFQFSSDPCGTLVIGVPSFRESHSVVFYDLQSGIPNLITLTPPSDINEDD